MAGPIKKTPMGIWPVKRLVTATRDRPIAVPETTTVRLRGGAGSKPRRTPNRETSMPVLSRVMPAHSGTLIPKIDSRTQPAPPSRRLSTMRTDPIISCPCMANGPEEKKRAKNPNPMQRLAITGRNASFLRRSTTIGGSRFFVRCRTLVCSLLTACRARRKMPRAMKERTAA
eukprot:scaffold242653_cov27-Tisochrysis_lutea.AAC.2